MKSIAQLNIFGKFHTETNVRFGEGESTPAAPKALAYANAVCAMLQARMNLEFARSNIPSYTGHLSDSDYYQAEEEVYNRACDHLYELARDVT